MGIKKPGRVVSNAMWIIGCKLVKALLTLIVTMITGRYLGPSNYGLINYAASIVTFITPLMKLGIDATMVHEIVTDPENEGKNVGSAIIMNLTSALLCIIGVVSFSAIANSGEMDTVLVCALYSTLLAFQAVEMIQYWFQAKLLSKYSAGSMLVSYVIVAAFQIYLLITKKSVYWFALSHSVDYCIVSILLLFFYKKLGTQKLSFSKTHAANLLSKGRFYIVSSMMVTIFANTDKIMLKLMLGNESVGYYSAATTCAGMTGFVFAAIIDSVRPTVFEAKKESRSLFASRLSELYSIIIWGSLIVSLGMTVFSSIIIKIMYGSDYGPAIAALRLVVWYTTFSYIGTVRNIWIVSEEKQQYLWMINLSGALMNIIINLILIPSFGIMGAAFASFFTQFFTNIIMGWIIKPIRENNRIMYHGLNPKPLYNMILKVFKLNR